jgi:hypothetical protein
MHERTKGTLAGVILLLYKTKYTDVVFSKRYERLKVTS